MTGGFLFQKGVRSMDHIIQSIIFGIIIGFVFDRTAYRDQMFSPVRLLLVSFGFAFAFGVAYTFLAPFSMTLA